MITNPITFSEMFVNLSHKQIDVLCHIGNHFHSNIVKTRNVGATTALILYSLYKQQLGHSCIYVTPSIQLEKYTIQHGNNIDKHFFRKVNVISCESVPVWCTGKMIDNLGLVVFDEVHPNNIYTTLSYILAITSTHKLDNLQVVTAGEYSLKMPVLNFSNIVMN